MCEETPKHKYSIEEYLEMEANSLEKLKYHAGEKFAMAGGTINLSLYQIMLVDALEMLLLVKVGLVERTIVMQKLRFLMKSLFMLILLWCVAKLKLFQKCLMR